ncbi:hypothetical protein CEXT_763501 [Caerostris extrusa]|uniref:Uncharacterized protein n=1 Tax=Caerostris extrusa TaxID=172846 RepID=A0AAV4TAC7_CAEEX|nr:hypothetical protein CEXT_763501 [Caerostris extrusa]
MAWEKVTKFLIHAEMLIIRSSNLKRIRVIISSSDVDELPQQIPVLRKEAKLNNDMGFEEQPGTSLFQTPNLPQKSSGRH